MNIDQVLKVFFISSIIILLIFFTLISSNKKFRDRVSIIKNNLVLTIYNKSKSHNDPDKILEWQKPGYYKLFENSNIKEEKELFTKFVISYQQGGSSYISLIDKKNKLIVNYEDLKDFLLIEYFDNKVLVFSNDNYLALYDLIEKEFILDKVMPVHHYGKIDINKEYLFFPDRQFIDLSKTKYLDGFKLHPSRECNVRAENVIKIDLSNFDYETIIDSEKIYKQIGILKNRNLSCDDPFHLNDVRPIYNQSKNKIFSGKYPHFVLSYNFPSMIVIVEAITSKVKGYFVDMGFLNQHSPRIYKNNMILFDNLGNIKNQYGRSRILLIDLNSNKMKTLLESSKNFSFFSVNRSLVDYQVDKNLNKIHLIVTSSAQGLFFTFNCDIPKFENCSFPKYILRKNDENLFNISIDSLFNAKIIE